MVAALPIRKADMEMPLSTGPLSTFYAIRDQSRPFSISAPMATTNASMVRRVLICRSGFSSAVSSGRSRSITPPQTISISFGHIISPKSYRLIAKILDVLENNAVYINTLPKCEPQLGKRGLYAAIGNTVGDKEAEAAKMAMLWLLNQSDGRQSLLDIAERAGLPFSVIWKTAERLRHHGLLEFRKWISDERPCG